MVNRDTYYPYSDGATPTGDCSRRSRGLVDSTYIDPLGDALSLHSSDLEEPLVTLLTYARLLSPEQRQRLRAAFGGGSEEAEAAPGQKYGADFDFAQEIGFQIQTVRAVRDQVLTESGKLRETSSIREGRDLITACNSLLGPLMKFHKELVTMERIRALEQALIEVLKEESPELRDRVLQKLQERLG